MHITLTKYSFIKKKRVFLDTNALSGIINGTNTLGDDIRKMTKFTHRYIFCFSSYTLYEIYKGDKKRWEKLLAFLSEIYFLVLFFIYF